MVPAGKEEKDAGGFRTLLETSPGQAARYLDGVHAADRAQWLRDVGAEDAWRVFGELTTESQAELIEYADDDLRAVLIARMSAGDLRGVLDELPSDEAADLLGEADTRVAEDVLAAIDSETAQELRELAAHEPDTAGGIMAMNVMMKAMKEATTKAVNDRAGSPARRRPASPCISTASAGRCRNRRRRTGCTCRTARRPTARRRPARRR